MEKQITLCYLCEEELGEHNETAEHIIPNVIGGRWKSKSLICRQCNITTGHLYEAEFAKLANIYSSKYAISREKGEVPVLKAADFETGKPVIIEPGYKISFAIPEIIEQGEMIYVKHHDKRRIVEEVKRISKARNDGMRLVSAGDFQEMEEDRKRKFIIDMPIEPNLLLRSVSKTIVNFYIASTGDRVPCKKLVDFIIGDQDNFRCWFLDLQIAKTLHNASPYHVLIVVGDAKGKMLYAYFEVFGEIGFIALLDARYPGPDLQLNYTFDPITAKEVAYKYDLKLSPSAIIQHLMDKPVSSPVITIPSF